MAASTWQLESSSADRVKGLGGCLHPAVLERYPLFFFAVLLLLGGWLGTTLDHAHPLNTALLSLSGLCLLSGGALWMAKTSGRFRGRWPWIAAIICSCLGVFGAGVEFGVNALPYQPDALSRIATRAKQPFAFRATVTSAAIWSPNPHHRKRDSESSAWRTQWDVKCTAYRHGQEWRPVEARSTLSVEGRVDQLLPGDQVEVFGSLRSIGTATNPGDSDPAEIGLRDGRFVYLSADNAEQIRRIRGTWSYPLQRLRGYAVRKVDRLLHRWVTHDQAPLAAALVFGQRQQVNWEDQQELMATGTLHMLAISGMHVEIVAAGVLGVCWLLRLGSHLRLLAVIFVIVLYAGLADAKPPVVRAAVLVLALELSRHFGRPARLANLLSLAAILIFLSQASHLANAGVHLSFLAVAAIGVFVVQPKNTDSDERQALRHLLAKSSGTAWRLIQLGYQWMSGMLRLSFWVWLITSPLVWYHFHVIAPIAIPLNILVSIPLGLALLSGLLTGILGWLPLIGPIGGRICGESLELISWLVDAGKQVAGGHIWLPSPPLWWIVLFYTGIGIWLLRFKLRSQLWLAATLVVWMLVGVANFASGPRGFADAWLPNRSQSDHHSGVAVTFLDVGHGTSVVIELPDGRVWLYDAGHLGAAANSHRSIAAALWHMQVARIDKLILSHADSDHYNAVRGLNERFTIGCVASTHNFWQSEDHAVRQLVEELKLERIACETWATGDADHVADASWQVLHPSVAFRGESDNASSMCFLLNYAGKRILLPGDLEGSGLVDLLNLPARPCHVLMAPHHGSLTRDPTELLRWCQPELVVISGNHRAIRPAVMERYQPWTRDLAVTFLDGAVRYQIGVDRHVQCHRWDSGWVPLEQSQRQLALKDIR